MGDDDHRQFAVAARQSPQRFVDFLLRAAVQGRGGFVEEQHLRFLVEGAGNADALLLPAGQAAAIFAQRRVQALGQGVGPFLQLHLLQHVRHLVAVGRQMAQRHVVGQRTFDDEYLLGNIAHQLVPCVAVAGGQLAAVDADAAFGGREETQQEVEQRGLARTAGAPHPDAFAPTDFEVQAVEQQAAVRKGKAQVLQADAPLEGKSLGRVSGFFRIRVGNAVGHHGNGVRSVLQRRPTVQDAAHGGNQTEGGHGKHAAHNAHVAPAHAHQQGNARHDGGFGKELGEQLVTLHPQAAVDNGVHALVERPGRRAERLGNLYLGIATEGFDHRARLLPPGFQLFPAKGTQTLADQQHIDDSQRDEHGA